MGLGRNSLLVSSAKLLEKGCAFAVILVASRRFGDEGVGQFFYYFSLASMLLPLMDMGFSKLLLQSWWAEQGPPRLLLGRLLVLKLLLGAVACGLVIAIDAVTRWGHANPAGAVAAFLAVFLEGLGGFLRAPAQAREDFRSEIVVPVVSRIVTLGLLLGLSGWVDQGYQLAWFYVAANALGAAMSSVALGYCRPRFAGVLAPRRLWALVRRGLPFSLTSFFVMVSFYVDSVMLGHFSFAQVGDYNAAYRIMIVVIILSGGGCQALFPKIVRLRQEGRARDAAWFLNGMVCGFVMLFGAMMLGGMLVGPQLVPLLFGPEFVESGRVFVMLAPLMLLAALTNLFGHTLEAMERQVMVMRVNLVSATFNVVANVILIPRYGMFGAGLTTILTELLTLVQYGVRLRGTGELAGSLHGVWRSALFVLVTGIAFVPLRAQPLWAMFAGGTVVVLMLGAAWYPWWPEAARALPAKILKRG